MAFGALRGEHFQASSTWLELTQLVCDKQFQNESLSPGVPLRWALPQVAVLCHQRAGAGCVLPTRRAVEKRQLKGNAAALTAAWRLGCALDLLAG